MARSLICLSPGLFGFKTLGSYEYFCHVEAALRARFSDAGRDVRVVVVDVHPTASIRRRAQRLEAAIARHSDGAARIHLVGHSTGGLDARLVASPTVNLSGNHAQPTWRPRLASVTTMNTPHYGTPMASFFATVSGQRLLYALSALTVVALSLGAPPLALTSSLVAAFGRVDNLLGIELGLVDRFTESVVRLLDDAASVELRAFLKQLRDDQGAIIQLSPEAMDLFVAGIEDDPSIACHSVASYAPPPEARYFAKALLSPWAHLSAPIFAAMYRITALESRVYPCAAPAEACEPQLLSRLGYLPPEGASDGVVPLRSQVWGELLWAGLGDHLDVVGHFGGGGDSRLRHVDWLSSGSRFDASRFGDLIDAMAQAMLRAEAR